MTELLALIGAVALIPVLVVLRGWVISVVWNWFMVPIFHAKVLSIPQALAVSVMVGLLTYQYRNDEREALEIWATALVAPFLTLAMAWVVRMFL